VLLQTKSVLHQPVRLMQLFEATVKGLPLVCVNVVGGGYDFGTAKPMLLDLGAALPQAEMDTLRTELASRSSDVGSLSCSLSRAVPNAIAVSFNPCARAALLDAAILDIVDKLGRSAELLQSDRRVQNYDSLIGANPAAVTRDSPAEETRLDDLEGHVQHGWTRAHIKVSVASIVAATRASSSLRQSSSARLSGITLSGPSAEAGAERASGVESEVEVGSVCGVSRASRYSSELSTIESEDAGSVGSVAGEEAGRATPASALRQEKIGPREIGSEIGSEIGRKSRYSSGDESSFNLLDLPEEASTSTGTGTGTVAGAAEAASRVREWLVRGSSTSSSYSVLKEVAASRSAPGSEAALQGLRDEAVDEAVDEAARVREETRAEISIWREEARAEIATSREEARAEASAEVASMMAEAGAVAERSAAGAMRTRAEAASLKMKALVLLAEAESLRLQAEAEAGNILADAKAQAAALLTGRRGAVSG